MRTVLIGIIAVLLLALGGLAISQTVLKSLPVSVTVTANQSLEVYSDQTAQTPVTRWYMGEVKRGVTATCEFYIKNLGEPMDIVIDAVGPEWFNVSPASAHLDPGQIVGCEFSIAPPFTAELGEVNASIEIKAGS